MSPDFSGPGAKWIYRMVRILAVPLQELVEKLTMTEEQILEVVRLVECQRTLTRSGLSPESMAVQALETHIERLETFYSMAMTAYTNSTDEVTTTHEVNGVKKSSTRPGRPQGSYLHLANRMSAAIAEAHAKLAKLPAQWKARAVAESRAKLAGLGEPEDFNAAQADHAVLPPEAAANDAQGHDAQGRSQEATHGTNPDVASRNEHVPIAAAESNSTTNKPTRLGKAERRERAQSVARREELAVTQT
jgi:hypothetical protein